MTASLIGARIQRKEDYRFLTGAGMYTDDVALPGQAYAAFVRSPHAHARIKKIAVDQAKKSPAVLAVYTGADLAANPDHGLYARQASRAHPDGDGLDQLAPASVRN